jgi:hypothetical protein
MEDNVDGGIGGTGAEDSSSEMSEMLAEISSSVFPDSSEGVTVDEPEVEKEDAATIAQPVTPAEPTKAEQPATPEGTIAADKLPTGWKPEVAQKFSTLPDDVKAEILKREEDFFKGINDYKVAADYGHSVHKMLQPYQQRLQEHGTNPVDYIASLARADNMIATAPTQEQKVQYFRELANMYGITVDHGLFGAEDSTVTALRQELNQLKSSVNSQLSQAQAKEVATIQKTIDEFRAKPEHKHFDVLQHEIAALLQSGVAKDLKDAYDRALWANPTTRVAEQTRLQEDKAKADAELQKKALEEAKKKKGINVRSTVAGSSGGKKTIEQTLNDTYDALQSRASH